jgi:hypothetical protein
LRYNGDARRGCAMVIEPDLDDDEEICGETYDHTWKPGDVECRECYADLSDWNDDAEA